MNSIISEFKRIVSTRSNENTQSILFLFHKGLYGTCFSTLRQELDSLIRVCYLNTLTDPSEKHRLINDTINGVRWKDSEGWITDKRMVSIASNFNKWATEVYEVGNSFTHLTNFHDYQTKDPLLSLDIAQKKLIRKYLNHYHFFSMDKEITFENIVPQIPNIATKVSDNLNRYLEDLFKDYFLGL